MLGSHLVSGKRSETLMKGETSERACVRAGERARKLNRMVICLRLPAGCAHLILAGYPDRATPIDGLRASKIPSGWSDGTVRQQPSIQSRDQVANGSIERNDGIGFGIVHRYCNPKPEARSLKATYPHITSLYHAHLNDSVRLFSPASCDK